AAPWRRRSLAPKHARRSRGARASAMRSRRRCPWSGLAPVVFVVAAPPDAVFVATLGRPVEPLVHTPQPVQPPRVSGVGVVDDAVLKHERAHARPVTRFAATCGTDAATYTR